MEGYISKNVKKEKKQTKSQDVQGNFYQTHQHFQDNNTHFKHKLDRKEYSFHNKLWFIFLGN